MPTTIEILTESAGLEYKVATLTIRVYLDDRDHVKRVVQRFIRDGGEADNISVDQGRLSPDGIHWRAVVSFSPVGTFLVIADAIKDIVEQLRGLADLDADIDSAARTLAPVAEWMFFYLPEKKEVQEIERAINLLRDARNRLRDQKHVEMLDGLRKELIVFTRMIESLEVDEDLDEQAADEGNGAA